MIHDSVLLHGWQYLFDANRTSSGVVVCNDQCYRSLSARNAEYFHLCVV